MLSTHEMVRMRVAHTAVRRVQSFQLQEFMPEKPQWVQSHPREGSESMDGMGLDNLWSMLSPLQKLTPIKTLSTAKALTSLYLTKEKLLPRDLTDIH